MTIKQLPESHPFAGNFDPLLFALGDALTVLRAEDERLEQLVHQQCGDVFKRADLAEREASLYSALCSVPASSIEAAALQMRALGWFNTLEGEQAEHHRWRVIHSVLRQLEAIGGGSREQWAGGFTLADDPFNHPVCDGQGGRAEVCPLDSLLAPERAAQGD